MGSPTTSDVLVVVRSEDVLTVEGVRCYNGFKHALKK